MSNSAPPEILSDVRDTVSSVHHDLNNPLSIISGNAQFLLELTKEKEDLDGQFESSAEDIQAAAEQIASSLHRLARLKKEIEDEL
ncbi:MAG: histidine kinase dimerization/phospho-acceptor domain-containing protein [Salinibacter sp.]